MTRPASPVRSLFRAPDRPRTRKPRRPHLGLHTLEDRTVPARIGYYDMGFQEGAFFQPNAIVASGNTPVDVFNLTPSELAGIDVLDVENPFNGGYGSEYVAHLGDIQNAVAAGMTLVVHDRFVDGAESILPGGPDSTSSATSATGPTST